MAMAVEASPARMVEKPPGQVAGGAGTALTNAEGGGAREIEDDMRWKPVLDLPCELIVDLPLPGFKIADLLKLRRGAVINAHWRVGQEVPLRLNGTLMGWIEFEVIGNNLAVRLTELA
jgi:flagellar motor switch/type III secretory pathway protein FliN